MIEIKEIRQPKKNNDVRPQKCNPELCNMETDADVHFYTALGKISDVIAKHGLDYDDFWMLVSRLDHYYQNWAEVIGLDLEDGSARCGEPLPSMLEI